jgi:uncharacterized membrane protein
MRDSDSGPTPWRTIVLVLSLCLNILLIAALVVGAARAARGGFIAQPGGALAPGAVMRAVTPERREALRQVMQGHRAAMMRLRQAARQARLDSFRVFAAPHYDNAAFAAALARVSAADNALEQEAVAQTRDMAAALTPQERQALIDRRRQAQRRSPRLRRLLNGN